MSSNRVRVQLVPGCSDGDPLHIPPPGTYTQVNPPTLYLEKVGQQWMQSRGEARPGVHYILEGLPFGYTLWQRPRPSNPAHVDRYLYGHPGKKAFDSPNRFYPHFEYLMNNDGDSMGCPCTVCSGSAGVLPGATPSSSRMRTSSVASSRKSNPSASIQSRPSSTHGVQKLPVASVPSLTQHKGRPKKVTPGLDKSNVDSEGTPDVYRNLIEKLRRHEAVDEAIEEPSSPDWRAVQQLLPRLLDDIKTHEQWVPRTGDIVLYIQNMPDHVDLVRDDDTQLQLYDQRQQAYLGLPQWKAGLVTEMATGTTVADLVDPPREQSVANTGVRVEPIPNPNDPDKSLSKRHKYVALRQVRPFVVWGDLLRRIPQEDWHVTIKNALALTSTLSLMGKHRFRGTWPNASVYCHGIYLGAELLAVGDTVRLLPNKQNGQSKCTDVMSIKSIRLKWTNLDKASSNDYDEGRPYNTEVWIYGSAYTSDAARQNKLFVTGQNVGAPRVAGGYVSDWYPLHPADKELAVPYLRVLGRLYERDAMTFFLRVEYGVLPRLDVGRQAVVEARAFSRKHDKRIADNPNATWYWGDDRADALNLRTINGREVSRFDPDRHVKDMRRNLRILDEIASGNSKPVGRDASSGRDLRDFMASALPLRSSALTAPNDGASSLSTASNSSLPQKRTHVVDLDEPGDDGDNDDDDDLDDEIRQHARLVEEDGGRPTKKVKVSVVIN